MLQQFFIRCSGADSKILKTCSEGEQNKYAGIGATVFFTAIMAFIASSYALFTVFDNMYYALFFGMLWGLLIFNLDRFIVSTIKKRDSFKKELLQATPRIILAIIIALVISKPLELKLFEKEINQVLLEQKNEMSLANKQQLALQYSPEIEKLNQDIADLKSEITFKVKETNALYDIYINEAEGTAGTKLLGKGPVYAEKREKHDAALTELDQLKASNTLKIYRLESQIIDLNNEYDTVVKNSQPVIDGFDGLMARVNALTELPWIPSFFIFLLFLAIETSPIVAKLLAPIGEYDLKLEEEESILQTWISQKVTQRQKIHETNIILSDKIHSELTEEEALYTYKKQRTIALMQKQADSFYDIQVKNL
ncbi:DUF4407 domain-containing protein [Kriegella sp. EG-1]|nr:DUF4407 domain-containing protein [Flavobacteriaceae bacterium EG-1]